MKILISFTLWMKIMSASKKFVDLYDSFDQISMA
jgi:hypothetical protein